MKTGDVVFFEIAKQSSSRKAQKLKFPGHGFGVLLGVVPPFQKDPPPEHLLRMMGTIGFLSFDDVAEFLGDESGAACVTKFENKYYGKVAQETPAEPVPLPTASPLVDLSGAPLSAPKAAGDEP